MVVRSTKKSRSTYQECFFFTKCWRDFAFCRCTCQEWWCINYSSCQVHLAKNHNSAFNWQEHLHSRIFDKFMPRSIIPRPKSYGPQWIPILCPIESMDSSVLVFMKILKNLRWFRPRRAVEFDRASGAIEFNCPSGSKSSRIFQNFHEYRDGTVHTLDGTQYSVICACRPTLSTLRTRTVDSLTHPTRTRKRCWVDWRLWTAVARSDRWSACRRRRRFHSDNVRSLRRRSGPRSSYGTDCVHRVFQKLRHLSPSLSAWTPSSPSSYWFLRRRAVEIISNYFKKSLHTQRWRKRTYFRWVQPKPWFTTIH